MSAVPCAKWFGWYGFIPFTILFAGVIIFACKIEKIKKDNDIFTYKEIIAFTEGKMLDEIEQVKESGKRPYQRFLLAIGGGVIEAVVCLILIFLLF